MSKKKLIMLFISITVLFVIIIGAAYAYFQASETINDLSVSVQTTGDSYVLTATTGDDISINITAADMSLANISNTTAVASASSTIAVKLWSANNTTSTSCTYDVQWQWQTGTGLSVYDTVDDNYVLGSNIGYFNDTTHAYCGTTSTTDCTEQKAFNYEMSITDSINNTEKDLTTLTSADTNLLTVTSGNSITSTDKDNETTVTHTITMKVYNLPIEQTNIRGKSFQGKVRIANIHCTLTDIQS